jgi:hypothetical protein
MLNPLPVAFPCVILGAFSILLGDDTFPGGYLPIIVLSDELNGDFLTPCFS